MTAKQLLTPRYKVISAYPGMGRDGFKVGSVLEAGRVTDVMYYNEYPHIFKPMKWWEERELKDMPKKVQYCDPDPDYSTEMTIIEWSDYETIASYTEPGSDQIHSLNVTLWDSGYGYKPID